MEVSQFSNLKQYKSLHPSLVPWISNLLYSTYCGALVIYQVYGDNPDWIGLNAGVFLIRNCEWSHKFLEKWMELGAPENIQTAKAALNTVLKSRPQEWDPDDQSVLVYLLNNNRKESEEKVFLEASYSLHGYFEYIVDEFEDVLQGKAKWPFVTHFCGCNFCGGRNITDRCTHGFERAFNFADNQLLRLVGLRHSSLSSYYPSNMIFIRCYIED